MTHASIEKNSFGDLFFGNFLYTLSQRDFFILHNFTFSDYTIKYKKTPLLFNINFYITTKIIPCDDFLKKSQQIMISKNLKKYRDVNMKMNF